MEYRQIAARADAVRTVERVVKAVWALARAQLPLADAAAAAAVRHVDELDLVLDRLAGAPVATRAPDSVLHVVFGPENALTGGLAERIRRMLARGDTGGGPLGVLGTRLHNLLADGPEAGRIEFHLRAPTSVSGLEAHARELAAAILGPGGALERGREVRLVHPVADRDELAVKVLLAGAREPVRTPPETLSPLPQVVAEVAAQALSARLAAALAESLRCEIRARLAATSLARQAAEDRLAELDRLLRAVRQGDITREVQELAAASLAGATPAS